LPAVAQLGLLTSVTVALSLLVSVVVLPALLVAVENAYGPAPPGSRRVGAGTATGTRTIDVGA
jgi:hypothetical protein